MLTIEVAIVLIMVYLNGIYTGYVSDEEWYEELDNTPSGRGHTDIGTDEVSL